MANAWYYAKGEERQGPVTSAELKTLAESGTLTPDDLIWKEGMEDWRPASELKGLFPAASAAAPPGEAAIEPIGIPAVELPQEPVPVINTSGSRPTRQHTDRKYSTMLLASNIYRIFGWIAIVLGAFGCILYLVSMIQMLKSLSKLSGSAAIGAFFLQIVFFLTGVLYLGIVVVSLWFVAEAIKCVIDIQSNTQRTSQYLQELLERDRS